MDTTEDIVYHRRRSTGSSTQPNDIVYHRRSAREWELAHARTRSAREQEAVVALEQLGECVVRTQVMALPTPSFPGQIRRACRPEQPEISELPRRVHGMHPRDARNQNICSGDFPPLEQLERALDGQYLHALVPPTIEKEVTASIVLCKVRKAVKKWFRKVKKAGKK
jgi:hypothetical protein